MHLVLSRLVAAQREQIATLSAFGFSSAAIASHFAKLAALVVVAGSVLGVGLGWWLGMGMTRMYAGFFRFPSLRFVLHLPVVAVGVSVAAAAAAARAAWRSRDSEVSDDRASARRGPKWR